MPCRTGSSAFATTASSEIATGEKNWPDAANCWACRLHWSHQNRPKITETGTKNLLGYRCASARSVTTAACSRLRHSLLTGPRQSKIAHEQHSRLRQISARPVQAGQLQPQLCLTRRRRACSQLKFRWPPPFSTFQTPNLICKPARQRSSAWPFGSFRTLSAIQCP